MGMDTGRLRYTSLLMILILCALMLTARIVYLFLADAERFPISTVKIVANYQHITRQQLEGVLSNYLNASFFALPVRRLHNDLLKIDWADQAYVQRLWPGTLKITLVEKVPVAKWNDSLMTGDGELFNIGKEQPELALPHLSGPTSQQMDVLQNYKKLSKLLETCSLQAVSLQLRDNQAWELMLTNGVQIRLGKRDMEKRLQRFCRAYPIVFADKPEQLARVDLRYAHGMAVQWKQSVRK